MHYPVLPRMSSYHPIQCLQLLRLVFQSSQNKRRAKSVVTTQQWACAGRLSPTTQGLALLGVDPTALHRISFLHKRKEKAQSIHVAVGKQHGGKSIAFANSVFK
jgi:16S rRNA U516 pseudouridylate synthase RsuA-like enzyme